MKNLPQIIAGFLVLIFFTFNFIPKSFAQNTQNTENHDDFFKAKIVDINNDGQETNMDGQTAYLQTLKLIGIEGAWKFKEIKIENNGFNILSPNAYKKNDIMIVAHSQNENGQDHFSVVDFVREGPIYFLGLLFAGLVIIIGRKKGIKALIALTISFLVIIYFIVPQIINGADPVLISATGAIIITVLSIYLTYGLSYFSHIASLSIGLSLIFTVLVSAYFTEITKLTGAAQEDATYLTQILGGNFNLKGLLLAGFIIGALGVLDDIVINQISLIEELHKLNNKLHWRELFSKGLKVGIDHISAIVNSLFLAYVGASLPLLLLFVADKTVKYSFSTIINLEIISTEIVRTLTGSLGLILSVPISTLIAAIFISKYSDRLRKSNTNKSHQSLQTKF